MADEENAGPRADVQNSVPVQEPLILNIVEDGEVEEDGERHEAKRPRVELSCHGEDTGQGGLALHEDHVGKDNSDDGPLVAKNDSNLKGVLLVDEDTIIQDVKVASLSRLPRYFDDANTGSLGKAMKCFNCGLIGHAASECVNAKRQRPCYLCAQVGHEARECPSRRCFKCGQKGHMSRECTSPGRATSECMRCGKMSCSASGKGDYSRYEGACMGSYTPSDLQHCKCYVCGKFGHLCCMETPAEPSSQTCFYCASEDHDGTQCPHDKRAHLKAERIDDQEYEMFQRTCEMEFEKMMNMAHMHGSREQGGGRGQMDRRHSMPARGLPFSPGMQVPQTPWGPQMGMGAGMGAANYVGPAMSADRGLNQPLRQHSTPGSLDRWQAGQFQSPHPALSIPYYHEQPNMQWGQSQSGTPTQGWSGHALNGGQSVRSTPASCQQPDAGLGRFSNPVTGPDSISRHNPASLMSVPRGSFMGTPMNAAASPFVPQSHQHARSSDLGQSFRQASDVLGQHLYNHQQSQHNSMNMGGGHHTAGRQQGGGPLSSHDAHSTPGSHHRSLDRLEGQQQQQQMPMYREDRSASHNSSPYLTSQQQQQPSHHSSAGRGGYNSGGGGQWHHGNFNTGAAEARYSSKPGWEVHNLSVSPNLRGQDAGRYTPRDVYRRDQNQGQGDSYRPY